MAGKRKATANAERLRIEYVPLDVVARWPRNPKLHADADLDDSLERFGFVAPAIRDERTKRLVAGHGRLDRLIAWQNQGKPAPKRIEVADDGSWLMPVVCGVAFENEREAEAYLLADNQITMLRGWDGPALQAIADDLIAGPGLVGTGFDEESIRAQMQARVDGALGGADGSNENNADEDEEDEEECVDHTDALVSKWKTAQGQIWEIVGTSGLAHRVLCGDCRKPEDVAKLLGDVKVNVAFTSPPYASQRKYDEESGFKPIHPDKFVDWFESVQANVRAHLAPDGSWFVNIKEHCEDGERHLYVKDLTIAHKRRWGWMFVDEFVWERAGVPGLWSNRFKKSWEPVFHFARADTIKFRADNVKHESEQAFKYSADNPKTPTGFITHRGHGASAHVSGMALPGNVIKCANAKDTLGHSAAFPVDLPLFFIKAYSDLGDAIFDPFLGSGTTVLAAEKLGRRGFGTELSAKYLAVILERMTSRGCKAHLVA